MEDYNLHQIIKEPTRVTNTSATLVDHVFTSVPCKVRTTKVPKIGISDHFPTCFVLKSSFGMKHIHTKLKYRCYKHLNEASFIDDLSHVPWNVIETFDDVDDCLDTWYKLFLVVIDKHLPWKERRVKRKQQPKWLTDDIIQCMSKRDQFKRRNDTVNYKATRNRCVALIRRAKTEYYKSCLNNRKGDSRELWRCMRELAPDDAKMTPHHIDSNNNTITDHKDIGEHFNDFFVSVVDQYILNQQPTTTFDKLKDMVNSRIGDDPKFNVPPITTEFVHKFLSTMDTNKATGLDDLSSKILKLSAQEIAKSLTAIYNISLASGKFPTVWKTSKITPVFKSGNHCDVNNYRPIAILCTLSKILERHIHNCFYNFLIGHNLLHTSQSGFRSQHSCETALLKLIDSWASNMEKGLLTGTVFVDFRKAFDMVDTNILLQKLVIYHCDNLLLSWFKSYLQNRQQCVRIQGTLSSTKPVHYGVPQGSILGPLLFIVFINDLPLCINTSNTDMYADDSTFHSSAKTVEELNDTLTDDMFNVHTWCNENNMVVNLDKTKAMLISTYQKAARLKSDLEVYYNGTKLKTTNTEKQLGVIIDKNLLWKCHIDKVAKTLSKGIYLLRRIKKFLPLDCRFTYYKSFLQPHIDYCCTIWGHSSHAKRILKLQNMALRIIYDKPKLTSAGPLFKTSGILTIHQRVIFRLCIFVYKALNNMAPQYISNMFKLKSSVCNRVTRSIANNNLWLPNVKLGISRNCLPYSGAKAYNNLPFGLRNINQFNSFRTELYKYIYKT